MQDHIGQDHIHRRRNGTIDYDFYRARARMEREQACSASIRRLMRFVRRIVSDPFSFHSLAVAQL